MRAASKFTPWPGGGGTTSGHSNPARCCSGAGRSLLAVAPEGGAVHRRSNAPMVLQSARDPSRAGARPWPSVDHWLTVLSAGLARSAPRAAGTARRPGWRAIGAGKPGKPSPPSRASCGDTGRIMGRSAWSGKGWRRMQPLTPDTWATALTPGEIDCIPTHAILTAPDWHLALAEFHTPRRRA